MKRTILATLTILLSLTVLSLQSKGQNSDQLEKLNAFAKTFGCVRYFHPSDQAALIDWEGMAYFGTAEILHSTGQESTEQLIERLFGPLVVNLEIYQGSEKTRPETKTVSPGEILAWQHKGVGLEMPGLYQSVRLNRDKKITNRPQGGFGNVLSTVDPQTFRGQEIRLRFDAKIEEGRCHLQGWWRVDRESRQRGLFENMSNRRIRDKSWNEYELTGTVDDDAENLTFGFMFFGSGSALIDNVRLEQKKDGEWATIKIPNPDFESGSAKPDGWRQTVSGYSMETATGDATSGEKSVRIQLGSTVQKGNKIFDSIPELGEVVDIAIAKDLRLRMPLALPVDIAYQSGMDPQTDKIIESTESAATDDADQQIASLANVVLLWNVFQHFYPYFDQVETDWDVALETALENGLSAGRNRDLATRNLQWLIAQLHDGHGNVYDMKSRELIAPVKFDWIENQLLVTASEDDGLLVGDIVTHVDGVETIKHLQEMEEYISGSPQWKRYRSANSFSMGTKPKSLSILRSDRELKRELKFEGRKTVDIDKGDVCRIELDAEDDEGDVWYIDMGRAEPKDINSKMAKLAKAKGIVLDFRGYPRGTQYLFQHMTDRKMLSQKWQVPEQLHPNRTDMKSIPDLGRWQMPPLKPRFRGKFVFITNASAISYAESCMSIVAHYQLGEIVGSPTAGANGNVNPFSLPGGYRVAWTGMRVMNHDDSQHHVNGVQVTVPMEPTIEGIRNGRDELLEKAIQVIGD